MKLFLTLSTILVAVVAKPSALFYPEVAAVRTNVITSAPVQSQFHAQDAFGQYSYGYSNALSSKGESKSLDGVTRGSYSYVDSEGKLQTVDYTADALNGFRVAATNLPQPVPNPEVDLPQSVEDTVEVVAARNAHLAAIEEANNHADESTETAEVKENDNLPKPVEDTPEVVQAREAHLAAKKEVELRNSLAAADISLTPVFRTSHISTLPIVSGLRTTALHTPFTYTTIDHLSYPQFAHNFYN